MKKIVAGVMLLAALACAGKQYSATEGPFRAKFARPLSWVQPNQAWSMPIYFQGVLPEGPIHVEGYVKVQFREYLRFHQDQPWFNGRIYVVQNKFTVKEFCEATGKPLDRFDPEQQFWNRGGEGPVTVMPPIDPEAVADGKVEVKFQFYELLEVEEPKAGEDEWAPGKLLAEAKTKVQLQCPQCRCGGTY